MEQGTKKKINLTLYQELIEAAEMDVENYFSMTELEKGSRYCLVDIECRNKPFVFADLNELDNFNIDYKYVVFNVRYKKDENGETSYSTEETRNF